MDGPDCGRDSGGAWIGELTRYVNPSRLCINLGGLPYRVDISAPPPGALDILVQLGALDVESVTDGIAAIMPDGVTRDMVAGALDSSGIVVSPAEPRDSDSVWLLSPRPVQIGNVVIASPEIAASTKTLRLIDSKAFGTGHHPTTALCIEAIERILTFERLDSVLDVGTGSGILALTALMLGVPRAVGLDTDAAALKVAAENARLNNFADRLQLILGRPDIVGGKWPLVVANVLAAPLIEMAPVLVRRVGRRGRLILSGIHSSLGSEVRRTYQNLGIRHIETKTRSAWTMLITEASW